MTTNLRRSLALVAGLVAVAAPVLSACGTQATDRPNLISNAGSDLTSSGMRVDGTRIVASADGKGVFIATITYNPAVDGVTEAKSTPAKHALTGISAAPGSSFTVDATGSVDKQVDAEGVANLATTDKQDGGVGGIPVTGSFKAGDIVPLVLSFADGTKATVETPVVTDCNEYSGAGTSSYHVPSANPSPSTAASPGVYDCAYPAIKPIG